MILIVDDDIAVQTSLSLLFKQSGFVSYCASNPKEGFKIINSHKPDVVILDLNYGNSTTGKEGLNFLADIKKIYPTVPVILMTAWASISLAVEGMKKGAFDFVSKPWNNSELLKTINTAIELNKIPIEDSEKRRNKLDETYDFTGIIGESPSITKILETIGRISKTDASVLILGETGTGPGTTHLR